MSERLHRHSRYSNDRGMTLIEMIVTLALTAIVITLTTSIIVRVLNETAGENATISGVQQAQEAERAFTQYLRSANQLLSIQTNDLTFESYAGTIAGVPQIETLEVQLCPTTSKYVDSLELIYGLPQTGSGSTGLHECIAADSTTSTTTPVPAGARLVEAFDIAPPGTNPVVDIFSYFTYEGGTFAQITTASAQLSPTTVSAIGINITFLPPPGGATRGYHTEEGTTVQTEVFLRNSSQ